MRGKIGVQTRLKHLWYGTPLYNRRIMKSVISTIEFNKSQKAQFRLKVIEFQSKYGIKATIDAFGVSRRSIFRWKRKLKQKGGKLESLIPQSREPKRKREMIVDWRVIGFIKRIRKEKGRIGKEKIKPLLDEYCHKNNLKTISVSTIGKVIRRYNLYYYKTGRYYHNPNSKWAKKKIRYKNKVKRSPKINQPGYIEIDTCQVPHFSRPLSETFCLN